MSSMKEADLMFQSTETDKVYMSITHTPTGIVVKGSAGFPKSRHKLRVRLLEDLEWEVLLHEEAKEKKK